MNSQKDWTVKKKMWSVLIVFVLLGVLLQSGPAFAYIDPGTASIAIQAVLAAFAGGLATIKLWGHRVTRFFRKKPPTENDNSKNG